MHVCTTITELYRGLIFFKSWLSWNCSFSVLSWKLYQNGQNICMFHNWNHLYIPCVLIICYFQSFKTWQIAIFVCLLVRIMHFRIHVALSEINCDLLCQLTECRKRQAIVDLDIYIAGTPLQIVLYSQLRLFFGLAYWQRVVIAECICTLHRY